MDFTSFWGGILTAEALSRFIDFIKDNGPKLKDRKTFKEKIINQLNVEKKKHVSDIPELSFEFSFEAYAETIVNYFSDKEALMLLLDIDIKHREIEIQKIINECKSKAIPKNKEAERLIEESVSDFCSILVDHYYGKISLEERARDVKVIDEIRKLYEENAKVPNGSSQGINNSKTVQSVVAGTSYKPSKNANKFNSFFSWKSNADVLETLNHLAKTLTDVPLTTRKVLARMVMVMSVNGGDCICNMDEVTTYFNIENWTGILATLERVEFIGDFDQADYEYYGYERRFFKDFDQWPIWKYIKIYCEGTGVAISRIFEDIDFTVFDE